MSGAAHHRGESRQDFETPPDLIKVVEQRFGKIGFDLAADKYNTKAKRFFSPEDDSLSKVWSMAGDVSLPKWLNPPFARIAPWAKKCSERQMGRILLLTPASVGSNWYRDYVHRRARVYFLNGRITFVGESQGYPKDCMLSVFGMKPGFEIWTWKENKLWLPS